MRDHCPKTCGTTCESKHIVGPCEIENGNCAHKCSESDGSDDPICSCYEGYKLGKDKKNCEDINECEENPSICDGTAGVDNKCINFQGSYSCSDYYCTDPNKNRKLGSPNQDCCQRTESTDEICGKDPNAKPVGQSSGKIKGGDAASKGSWPWMVYIEIIHDSWPYPKICGGSLIHPEWVLTAAHCFREQSSTSAYDTTLKFGLYKLPDEENEPTPGHVRTRKGIEIIYHEDWIFYDKTHSKSFHNDLAIIKLNKPLEPSSFVYPICLPKGETPKPGDKCWVTGFTDDEGETKELQQVDLPITTDEECKEAYKKYKHPVNESLMFCAGYKEGGKDSCDGDSGGPLMCQRQDSCSWYVFGVVSYGEGCALEDYFGVYTKVTTFEQWITKTIGEDENNKPESISQWITSSRDEISELKTIVASQSDLITNQAKLITNQAKVIDKLS